MNLSNLPFSNEESPIIYYQGTFDPAHLGHLSALETVMKKLSAAAAVIVVDQAENPHKPHRSPWEIRKAVALRTFGHLKNVCISSFGKEETKEKLLKKAYVVALLGYDILPLYLNRTKIVFQALCFVERTSYESAFPESVAGKPVIYVTPDILDCSSTKIRNYLITHPEVYEESKNFSDFPLNKLSFEALEYILQNKIYYQSSENRLKKIKEKVESYVKDQIFKERPLSLICLTNTAPSQIKLGGQSGDLTFLAFSEDQKIFVKVYLKNSHLTDIENEFGGMELLNSLSLSWAKTVGTPHYKEKYSTDSHLGLPYLDGLDLAKFFQNIENAESEARFINMCFCVGRSLSELHHVRSCPINAHAIQKQTDLLNERTEARLKKIDLDKADNFKTAFNSSYENFLKNPGVHTYAHGDANLSNFIVDEDTEKVYMLDLERLFLQKSESEDPLGFPGEDYYRFLGGLTWQNEENKVSAEILSQAQEAFKRGYATFPSCITPEAHRYFSNYWKIRNYKINPIDPV